MSLPRGWLIALIFAELVAASALSCAAQAPAVPAQPAASSPSDQKPTINVPVPAQAQPQEPSASDQTTVERKTYTVPAGTKVLPRASKRDQHQERPARRWGLLILDVSGCGRQSRHDP